MDFFSGVQLHYAINRKKESETYLFLTFGTALPKSRERPGKDQPESWLCRTRPDGRADLLFVNFVVSRLQDVQIILKAKSVELGKVGIPILIEIVGAG